MHTLKRANLSNLAQVFLVSKVATPLGVFVKVVLLLLVWLLLALRVLLVLGFLVDLGFLVLLSSLWAVLAPLVLVLVLALTMFPLTLDKSWLSQDL